MSIDDLLGGLSGKPDHDTRMRIVKLESRIESLEKSRDAHKNALRKANELLKECILRIERLEGAKTCKHTDLIGSVIDETEPLTCTGCGATVGRDGVVIQG